MTHSTQKNTVSEIPKITDGSVTGRYLLYPEGAGKRLAEGGLRTKAIYKHSMPDAPLVTIITVSLNSAKTIRQTIESVLNQTYSNIEYILVDGASTDDTLNVIKQFDDAIDYYISEPDAGLYQAINKGLELASGQYILILNSDDWYVDSCVEELVDAAKYSCCDFVSALARVIGLDEKPAHVMRHLPFDMSACFRMTFRHETMLISKEIYEDIGGYDETYKVISDMVFAAALYKNKYTAYPVERPLLNFRLTGVSSTNLELILVERPRWLKAQFPFLEEIDLKVLADRENHSFIQLEKIARKYISKRNFVEGLRSYATDMNKFANWHKGFNQKDHKWTVVEPDYGRPLISFIMPVFNAQETIQKCLDSICAQTVENIEVVCVDDVSTDGSATIIRQFMSKDSRVKLFSNDKNIGCGATRNKGVRESRGRYIFNIDPDDTIPNDALEQLYSFATKYDSDMVRGVYFKGQSFFGKKASMPLRISLLPKNDPTPEINTNLYKSNILINGDATVEGHWAFLYKRHICERVPWPIDLKMGQDAIFLVGALLYAKKITIIDAEVYNYSLNTLSAMNVFNYQKYDDVLEWRRRAWHLLNNAELTHLGNKLIQDYLNTAWHDRFFEEFRNASDSISLHDRFKTVCSVFSETGVEPSLGNLKGLKKEYFKCVFDGDVDKARKLIINSAGGSIVKDSEIKTDTLKCKTQHRINSFWSISTEAIQKHKQGDNDKAINLYRMAKSMVNKNLPDEIPVDGRQKYLNKLKTYLEAAHSSPAAISHPKMDSGVLVNVAQDPNLAKLQRENTEFIEQFSSTAIFEPTPYSDSVSNTINNEDMEEFGIILFGHTRLDTLKATLESLERQDALQYTEVWLDGDQGNFKLRKQLEETAELVNKYPIKKLHKQRANFGFRKMMILGLTEMSKKYRDILILEDDCFPVKDAVVQFRKELEFVRDDCKVFSVYGHKFLVDSEKETCARFQGWGWATTSEKLKPVLQQLIHCYSMTEENYLKFVDLSLTDEIRSRIEVTPPRQPSHTLEKFFAWDETVCLLTALNGQVHRPTSKPTIYNCGMGVDSTHFKSDKRWREPPFNLITPEEVWDYF